MKTIILFPPFCILIFVMKKHPGMLVSFFCLYSIPLVFLLYSQTECCSFISVLTAPGLSPIIFVFFKIILSVFDTLHLLFFFVIKCLSMQNIHIEQCTNQESKFNAFSKIDHIPIPSTQESQLCLSSSLNPATLLKSNYYSII